jgi:hypothetical protein
MSESTGDESCVRGRYDQAWGEAREAEGQFCQGPQMTNSSGIADEEQPPSRAIRLGTGLD